MNLGRRTAVHNPLVAHPTEPGLRLGRPARTKSRRSSMFITVEIIFDAQSIAVREVANAEAAESPGTIDKVRAVYEKEYTQVRQGAIAKLTIA